MFTYDVLDMTFFSTNSLFRVVIVAYLPWEKFLEVSRSSFNKSVNASHWIVEFVRIYR